MLNTFHRQQERWFPEHQFASVERNQIRQFLRLCFVGQTNISLAVTVPRLLPTYCSDVDDLSPLLHAPSLAGSHKAGSKCQTHLATTTCHHRLKGLVCIKINFAVGGEPDQTSVVIFFDLLILIGVKKMRTWQV
jgi:hypothetical protein